VVVTVSLYRVPARVPGAWQVLVLVTVVAALVPAPSVQALQACARWC
jgi:hypothetical protein